jgi:peptidyl-prolyl cis-trans isomerase A (cyclophilin A)
VHSLEISLSSRTGYSHRWVLSLSLAFALLVFAGFGQASAQSAPQAAAPSSLPDLPDAPGTTAAPKSEPIPTGPTIVFDTTMGRLTCKTFDKQAPNAVVNFIGLVEGTKDWTINATHAKQHGKRFYDGLTFHRVIPGFMIQGGDPVGDGTGDAGYYFDDEIDPALKFTVGGRLAMANSGPDTNGSQFFITEDAVDELNGKYTIFGQCDAHSTLLAASIARVARDGKDKPLVPVVIQHVTVVREGQAMPPAPDVATAPTQPAPTPVPNLFPNPK